MRSAHSLVIGGTGMLAAATRSLIDGSRVVSLLARHPDRLHRTAHLSAEQIERLAPLPLDLAEGRAVIDALASAIDTHGPIERAILWIHSPFEATAREVLALIARTSPPAGPSSRPRIVRVFGSASADPALDLATRAADWAAPELDVRVAILGFEVEAGTSRWLTHDEISTGVSSLLERAPDPASARSATVEIIGRTEPWSARP